MCHQRLQGNNKTELKLEKTKVSNQFSAISHLWWFFFSNRRVKIVKEWADQTVYRRSCLMPAIVWKYNYHNISKKIIINCTPTPSICKLVTKQLGVSPQLLNQHVNLHKYKAVSSQERCLQWALKNEVVFCQINNQNQLRRSSLWCH